MKPGGIKSCLNIQKAMVKNSQRNSKNLEKKMNTSEKLHLLSNAVIVIALYFTLVYIPLFLA